MSYIVFTHEVALLSQRLGCARRLDLIIADSDVCDEHEEFELRSQRTRKQAQIVKVASARFRDCSYLIVALAAVT